MGTLSRDDQAKEGITRRGFVKAAIALGGASVVGVGGYAALQTLTQEQPPTLQETFLYVNPVGAKFPVWVVEQGLVGEEARLSHFREGDGAVVRWRWHLGEDGQVEGLPALLVRVEDEKLEFPGGYPRDEFVVDGLYALFNHCPHAGCRPAWKVHPVRFLKDRTGPKEPICCACHYAQFHPWEFAEYRHPPPPESTGAAYVGVRLLGGPANRGMPLIPIEVQGDVLIGKLKDPSWYRYLDFREGL